MKNDDAFTHQLTLQDQVDSITISVMNGHTLSSAVGDLTIGENAAIELDTGTIATGQERAAQGRRQPLSGNGKVIGDLVVGDASGSAGTLSPGFSVGHLDVEGDYEQQSNGTLEIDVDGTLAGEYDTVEITGAATLDGTITFTVRRPGGPPGGRHRHAAHRRRRRHG